MVEDLKEDNPSGFVKRKEQNEDQMPDNQFSRSVVCWVSEFRSCG
jgi:hypothetical protein